MRAKPEIKSLTGLRGVAAVLVWLFHAKIDSSAPFTSMGPVGVSAFFVLSGFIMTYTYDYCAFDTKECRKAFWWKRIARIVPSHEAALCLCIPQISCLWERTCTSIGKIPATIFLVQSWVPGFIDNFNGVTWTICLEMLFYFFFPVLVKLPFRKYLPWVTVWCLLPTVVAAAAAPDYFFGDFQYLSTFVTRFFLFRAGDFTMGIMIAQIAREFGPLWRVGTNRQPKFWLCYFAPSVVLAVVMGLPYTALGVYFVEFFCAGVMAPLFAPVILGLAVWDEDSPVGAFLSWAPIYLFGTISYAFYLVQLAYPLYFDGLVDNSIYVILWFFTTTAIAVMLHTLVEQPSYRYLLQRWPRRCACTSEQIPLVSVHTSTKA